MILIDFPKNYKLWVVVLTSCICLSFRIQKYQIFVFVFYFINFQAQLCCMLKLDYDWSLCNLYLLVFFFKSNMGPANQQYLILEKAHVINNDSHFLMLGVSSLLHHFGLMQNWFKTTGVIFDLQFFMFLLFRYQWFHIVL